MRTAKKVVLLSVVVFLATSCADIYHNFKTDCDEKRENQHCTEQSLFNFESCDNN
jgi:hypothetical protein